MPAPTELPEWASGGSAAITDPTLAEKQLGWTDGEEPPAEYFNWWMNLVFLWISYLSTAALKGVAQSFTALQTFAAGLTVPFGQTLTVFGSQSGPALGFTSIPAFTNSWHADATSSPKGSYALDPFGNVVLHGWILAGTADAIAFTLPAGMRPQDASIAQVGIKLVVFGSHFPSGIGTIQIKSDGSVTVNSGGGATGAGYVDLTGARFNVNGPHS